MKYFWIIIGCFLWVHISAQETTKLVEFRDTSIDAQITHVQPMTGIVFWQGSNTNTDAISLEFSYMLFNDVVKDSGIYDWSKVDQKLDDIASRNHQAIFRFRYTYVGKKTSVPDYIKNRSDYHETEGLSEGQNTWFPDWTNEELQRFSLEFYTRFAARYDHDSRLAFIEVGFGLWGEYHIYDGPFILGKTFPSKAFQEQFFYLLDTVFKTTPWSISIDAADDIYSPFKEKPELLAIKFGNFDDSFMCKNHSGYNESCWKFFGADRTNTSPAGGEFSYYTIYDQQHVLDFPNGDYGISYEDMAAKFHITFIIGNDQPEYQSMERIKQACLASGYQFKISSIRIAVDSTILVVTNIGVAPFYYDAFPTINGVRSLESLKNLPSGASKEFHIAAGGNPLNLTIESDRLLSGQNIEYYGTSYNVSVKKKLKNKPWKVYPSLLIQGEDITITKASITNEFVNVNIFDLMGNLVLAKQLAPNESKINMSEFHQGIYVVQIIQSDQVVDVERIVVQ